ncbi:MAG TPA: hypothetical protein VI913_03715 [Candidatus Peribacteraceae bacterium]|nr:hypothetical protein [Candidatus Peribacteraceae bacterium]
MTVRLPESRLTKRSSLGQMVAQSTMLLMISIGLLILLLALLILFHQNANATKGYSLRTLERERHHLLLELETVNMEIARAQALTSLETDKQLEAMAEPRQTQYAPTDIDVACRP